MLIRGGENVYFVDDALYSHPAGTNGRILKRELRAVFA